MNIYKESRHKSNAEICFNIDLIVIGHPILKFDRLAPQAQGHDQISIASHDLYNRMMRVQSPRV